METRQIAQLHLGALQVAVPQQDLNLREALFQVSRSREMDPTPPASRAATNTIAVLRRSRHSFRGVSRTDARSIDYNVRPGVRPDPRRWHRRHDAFAVV